MDLGFPIRHLQDKLNEFRLDLHRLRLYRSESWNYNVEHRVKEYEQAIAILTKANGVEQSESTCNLQNVSQQRELLFAFGKYLQKRNISDFTPQMFIDDFLSEQ